MEPKSLVELLNLTNEKTIAKVNLIVDRTSCPSCRYKVIQDFYRQRPGIALNVIQGKDVRKFKNIRK